MEKMIKKLLKESVKLRTLSISLKCSTLQNHVNSSEGTLTLKTLDNYKDDIQKLNSSQLNHSARDIIKNTLHNFKDIKKEDAVNLLTTLRNEFFKTKQLPQTNLKDSEEFVHLCKIIHKNVKTLPVYDLIRVLQVLTFFNVPSNTVLIQTVLQLISCNLNNLSVGRIMVLYNTLNKLERVPLVKSLLIALPHVFKQQAQFELNSESPNLLRALKFSCAINDLKTKNRIIKILYENEQNIKSENIVDICYALFTLHKLDSVSKKLLFILRRRLKTETDVLTFNDIQHLFNYISKKIANKEMEFVSDVLDPLCNATIKHNVTFRENIIILGYLNKIHYSNTLFLDHLLIKCYENKDILKYCLTSELTQFIKGFIIADHKPKMLQDIQTTLVDFIKYADCSAYNSAGFAFHLLSLGCYCPELIEEAFTLYQSNINVVTGKTTSYILKLHWCVKLLYPQYNGVILDDATLDKIDIKREKDKDISLLETLKETLVDDQCIKKGLKTRFGKIVDYVVVVQPNGVPMNVSNYDANITFVEDLQSLPECKKILFFTFPETAYSINKGNMLSTEVLLLKAIESLKRFYTIAINPTLWKISSEKQKISYLKQVVSSKCNVAGILRH